MSLSTTPATRSARSRRSRIDTIPPSDSPNRHARASPKRVEHREHVRRVHVDPVRLTALVVPRLALAPGDRPRAPADPVANSGATNSKSREFLVNPGTHTTGTASESVAIAAARTAPPRPPHARTAPQKSRPNATPTPVACDVRVNARDLERQTCQIPRIQVACAVSPRRSRGERRRPVGCEQLRPPDGDPPRRAAVERSERRRGSVGSAGAVRNRNGSSPLAGPRTNSE